MAMVRFSLGINVGFPMMDSQLSGWSETRSLHFKYIQFWTLFFFVALIWKDALLLLSLTVKEPNIIYIMYTKASTMTSLPTTLRYSLMFSRNFVVNMDILTFSGVENWCRTPPADSIVEAWVYCAIGKILSYYTTWTSWRSLAWRTGVAHHLQTAL